MKALVVGTRHAHTEEGNEGRSNSPFQKSAINKATASQENRAKEPRLLIKEEIYTFLQPVQYTGFLLCIRGVFKYPLGAIICQAQA